MTMDRRNFLERIGAAFVAVRSGWRPATRSIAPVPVSASTTGVKDVVLESLIVGFALHKAVAGERVQIQMTDSTVIRMKTTADVSVGDLLSVDHNGDITPCRVTSVVTRL